MTRFRLTLSAFVALDLIYLSGLATATPLEKTTAGGVRSSACVWEFSPGSEICGEDVSSYELVYPRNGTCLPVPSGMKNVWTNECSDLFGKS